MLRTPTGQKTVE